MDDSRKKAGRAAKGTPDERWVELLGGSETEAPSGVTIYTGLLRKKPDHEDVYQLYRSLDMRAYLEIQKEDVLHWEDLPPDKSPFGSLGGVRCYVRQGAKITSVRTSATTYESGDEFDLDVRLGRAVAAAASNDTIPDTGCGPACETIPPFTDGCQNATAGGQFTCNNCTIDTCPCIPTESGKTCGVNCQITRAFTCISNCPTNCGTCAQTCQTCQTNCGTCPHTQCATCNTHCGTCAVNTCSTKCHQETCGPCTHIFTQCGHGCQPQ